MRSYDHLSKEDLVALLQKRDRERKLGLVWERDEIEHDRALNDDFVVMDFVPDFSVGQAPYHNLVIEGDNYDALRYLRMTHAGRVKCIYIDPPYNTGGAKDFVYNDSFIEPEDVYRHSKWIEFMYQRLVLAKDLLSAEGMIFVSIDDNELFHLGLLMDRVFGAGNFVANLVWKRKAGGSDDSGQIVTEHEYVLCFALNVKKAKFARVLHESPSMTAKYNRVENGRRYYLERLDKTSLSYSKSMDFPIKCPDGSFVSPPQPDPKNPRTSWRWGKATIEERYDELEFAKDKKTGEWRVYTRTWEPTEGVTPRSLLVDEHHGRNRDGTQELAEILGPRVFNNPKPTRFMRHLLNIGANEPDALVLDFFAGSGSTAEALLQLNAQDGGNRRFILVSSTEATKDDPDKNICRDVCAKRVGRVMTGYKNQKKEAVAGMGGGFAYLRVARIPSERLAFSIKHAQVWLALQQMHAGVVIPPDPKATIQVVEGVEADILYLSQVNVEVIKALKARAAAAAKPWVVYSWQPGLVRQRILSEHVDIRPIPEWLIAHFGGAK